MSPLLLEIIILLDMCASKTKTVLLITSYAPHAFGGSSFMLHRFIKQWTPRSNVLILTSGKGIKFVTSPPPVPTWYYDLKPNNSMQGKKKADAEVRCKCRPILPKIVQKFLRMFLDPFNFIRELQSLLSTGVKILSREEVDKILIASDRGIAFWGGYLLSRRYRKPYSLLMFDLYRGNFFYPFERFLAFALERLLFSKAEHIFVAGEGLLEYFQRRYERTFTLVRNAVDLNEFSAELYSGKVSTPIKILYAGAVYWAQADALKTLVEAIAEDAGYRLLLYSPHPVEILRKRGLLCSNVELGFLSREELLNAQSTADVLFLPLSFRRAYRPVVETAPTSKLCEYMASRKPILILAPPYSFVSRYAAEQQIAMVVTDNSPKVVKEALEKLRTDALLRAKLVENAWRLVVQNHEICHNASLIEERMWN